MKDNSWILLVGFGLASAIMAAACLHSISATPETINGRPAIEVCAELMAKAAPSGTPRAVATVVPSAAPTGGL